ncbi:MAG: sigma-54 dependent transcriptional regulator [Bacteroidota bacterium]
MKKVLVSWVSHFLDFEKVEPGKILNEKEIPKVNESGPTSSLHQKFYTDHDYHLLLDTTSSENLPIRFLANYIEMSYPSRTVLKRPLGITNAHDYLEVKTAMESILDELSIDSHHIDMLITTGTTPMRMMMLALHLTHSAPTHLIQGFDPKLTDGEARFEPFVVRKDEMMGRLYVRTGENIEIEEGFKMLPILKPIYDKADKIAKADPVKNIMIRGASGSGKENLAKFIHQNSSRASKTYMAINCASLTDTLLESRLFGHKKGSFTGANQDQKGLFQLCHKGTLFLDEIGDISMEFQASLLRVLQDQEFTAVGGSEVIKTDVRVITATNRNLEEMIQQGSFRGDLYYRLAYMELELPSLAEYPIVQKEELIRHLLHQLAKLYGVFPLRLSGEVHKQLLYYPYPGNIRQLEGILNTLYVFAEEKAELEHLPKRFKEENPKSYLSWKKVEEKHIRYVLKLFNYNQTHSSEALGFSYGTLKNKMKEYGIVNPHSQRG